MLKTPRWHFSCARELFEAARDASADAHRVALQLARMEDEGAAVGSPSLSPRVSGTGDPQRMESRVVGRVDREAALRRREDEDYMLIDLADAVLWGTDWETGLDALVPGWWCDALWHHYLGRRCWAEVGRMLGYSAARCKQVRDMAFDVVDSWGIVGTVEGRALNDPETWERDARRREARETLAAAIRD